MNPDEIIARACAAHNTGLAEFGTGQQVAARNARKQAIYEFVKAGLTAKETAAASGMHISSVKKAIAKLNENGGKPAYERDPDGMAWDGFDGIDMRENRRLIQMADDPNLSPLERREAAAKLRALVDEHSAISVGSRASALGSAVVSKARPSSRRRVGP